MLGNAKALVVVLTIALVVFALVRPICQRFISAELFARRRNCWFALTIIAFLSPTFWVYAFLAAPLLIWVARKDPNPAALYLLVYYVIPPVSAQIPVVAINQLFDINQARLLGFIILIPLVWRIFQTTDETTNRRLKPLDFILLTYIGLQLVLVMPYESATNSMRRGFLLFIDIGLVYYVFSRLGTSRQKIVDAMMTFCLACALFAAIAFFESIKGWLLYQGIGEAWGAADVVSWLQRGDSLRAQASAGHALTLGHLMAVGFGFWLYLQAQGKSMQMALAGAAWMWVGLISAHSRGPWLTAVVFFFVFLALSPQGASKFAKGLLFFALLSCIVLASPLGASVIDNLPFIGTIDEGNVTYRQQLAEVSWMLVWNNPFFGDPFVLLNMESLRQGQGIIDLVNAYASVALFYGIVGLVLFLGLFLIPIWRAYRVSLAVRESDPDLSLLGANLISCVVATMFYLAVGGHVAVEYLLAGLAASYGQLKVASYLSHTSDKTRRFTTNTRKQSSL